MPSHAKILRRKYSSRSIRRRLVLYRMESLAYYAGACLLLVAVVFIMRGMFSSASKKVEAAADNVAAFRIPHAAFVQLQTLSEKFGVDFAQATSLYAIENAFFPVKTNTPSDVALFMRDYEEVRRGYREKDIVPYYELIGTLLGEIQCFPVPDGFDDGSYMYGDTWSAKTVGADIIDRENVHGRIPVVSMTDGVVTDAGWNEKTGFEVTIKTANDTQYSYSRLDAIADGLAAGSAVQAGAPLGRMGNVGTSSARLHLEIAPRFTLASKAFQINPYPFLRLVEEQRAAL